jgi:hypothetical protein
VVVLNFLNIFAFAFNENFNSFFARKMILELVVVIINQFFYLSLAISALVLTK